MIILTAEQADHVRGMDTPGAALMPALLADGVTYVLPESVLTDPAHVAKHDYLAALPVRNVADSEWPAPPPRGV